MAVFIADAIEQYILSLQAERASKATVRLYGYMLGRLEEFARLRGRTRIDELTLEVVRGAIAGAMRDPGPEGPHPNWKGGEATARAMAHAVRSFGAALRADGVAIADFSVIKPPDVPERIQPRLEPQEFRALEEAALRRLMTSRAPRLIVARDVALLSFMADTGLRAAEICALNVEDLDLEAATVTIQRGKGSKARVLNIRDADAVEADGGPTLRALRDYLDYRTQTFGRSTRQRALWLTRRGARLRPDGLRSELAKLCEEAGIEGNRPPHAFRRGYFSAEYRRRPTALPILRARMGWSPRSHHMVDIYTRGAEIDLAREQSMDSVSKRWRGAGPKPSRRTLAGPPRRATVEAILELLRGDPELSEALAEALSRKGA